MEKMAENKFQELSVEEMEQIDGGKLFGILVNGQLVVIEY